MKMVWTFLSSIAGCHVILTSRNGADVMRKIWCLGSVDMTCSLHCCLQLYHEVSIEVSDYLENGRA